MEWLLSLEDKMSGPAEKAEKRLEQLEQRMKGLAKAEKEASDPAMQKRLASRINSLGLAKIETQIAVQTERQEEHAGRWVERLDHGVHLVKELAEAAKVVAEHIYDWGKESIALAGGKQRDFLSFRTMIGDEEKAKKLMEDLEGAAHKSVFSGSQATSLGRKLLAGGFAAEDVPTYLRAIGDAAAATGASEESIDKAVGALRRINADGKLSEKTMRALRDVGVDSASVYEVLAKDLHVTAGRAREMVKAGDINANEGLWAIVGGVNYKRSGGMLGSAGETAVGESSDRLLGKIKESWEENFANLWDTKGFGKWIGFLRNMNGAMDSTSASGKALKESIGSAFDHLMTGVFGDLSGPDGLPGVEGMVKSIAGAIDGLGYAAGGLAKGLFKNLDPALAALSSGPMDAAKAKLLSEEFEKLGDSIGKSVRGAAKLLGLVGKLAELGGEGLDQVGKFAYRMAAGKAQVETGVHVTDPVTGLWLAPEDVEQQFQARLAMDRATAGEDTVRLPLPVPSTTAAALAGQQNSPVYSPTIEQTMTFNGPADPQVVRQAAKQGAQQGAQLATIENLAMAGGGIR
jgi:tape measure domain-containing protein